MKEGMTAEAKEDKTAIIENEHLAKHTVWLAKSEAEKEEFATVYRDGDGIFRTAKEMDCTNQDIVGELALTDQDKMKAWIEHYARLLNVDFEWPSNESPKVPPTAGPPPSVSATLICKALSKMKRSKAKGVFAFIYKEWCLTKPSTANLIEWDTDSTLL